MRDVRVHRDHESPRDAIRTELGDRHELYEYNYATTRLDPGGTPEKARESLAELCVTRGAPRKPWDGTQHWNPLHCPDELD